MLLAGAAHSRLCLEARDEGRLDSFPIDKFLTNTAPMCVCAEPLLSVAKAYVSLHFINEPHQMNCDTAHASILGQQPVAKIHLKRIAKPPAPAIIQSSEATGLIERDLAWPKCKGV